MGKRKIEEIMKKIFGNILNSFDKIYILILRRNLEVILGFQEHSEEIYLKVLK